MQVLGGALPTRSGPARAATPLRAGAPHFGAARAHHPPRQQAVAPGLPASYPSTWIAVILLVSACTLPVLAFVNARGASVSAGVVALVEAVIFAACLGVQMRRLSPWALAFAVAMLSWVVLTWLIRQRPDLKGLRDLVIVLLFIGLGRRVADAAFAEATVRRITLLVLLVALFETLLPALYGSVFNAFAFYAKLGSIRESAAMFGGQTLTLNGYRPDGIGRTVLPEILGMHRTSSIFLEPVSLGNFAVIVMAWNLSRAWGDWSHAALLQVASALLLMVLSDSRFGMVMVLLLLVYRLLPRPLAGAVALAYPLMLLGVLLGVAWWLPTVGDNVLGRISASGQALLRFDEARLMGLGQALPHFGDMGYAYVLSRFGAVAVIALFIAWHLIAVTSERAQRFRGLLVLYVFSSLAISGTSVFALKTAALMWFLFGALSADPRLGGRPVGGRAV